MADVLENEQQYNAMHIVLEWCGPEPKHNLKEFIDEKMKCVSLMREIKQIWVEIEQLVDELNYESPATDLKEQENRSSNLPSSMHRSSCLAMRRAYPELLEETDGCIYKEQSCIRKKSGLYARGHYYYTRKVNRKDRIASKEQRR